MMENYRILANPCLLADETKINVKISFKDKLKEIVSHEYNKVYIPQNIYDKMEKSIQNHINDLVIEQIINETINCIIESIINDYKEKKFDFCLPFE